MDRPKQHREEEIKDIDLQWRKAEVFEVTSTGIFPKHPRVEHGYGARTVYKTKMDQESVATLKAMATCVAIVLLMRFILPILPPGFQYNFTDAHMGGAFAGILLQAVIYLVWKKR